MIIFEEDIDIDSPGRTDAIFFDRSEKPKLIQWLSRAANTLMTDKDLISLLDEMKK